MNENENMETVETYDQGTSVFDSGNGDSILSSGDDPVASLESDAGMDPVGSTDVPILSVSSGNALYILDSHGDYIPVSALASDAQTEQVEVQNFSADDLEPYFTALNHRLDCIIFLLLFYWCARKIKIAVANFTGRSLDNGKDVL